MVFKPGKSSLLQHYRIVAILGVTASASIVFFGGKAALRAFQETKEPPIVSK